MLNSFQVVSAISNMLAFFRYRDNPHELNLNPRYAIRTQQQRQFPGVGQVVVEEPPDRLDDQSIFLGDSVGG